MGSKVSAFFLLLHQQSYSETVFPSSFLFINITGDDEFNELVWKVLKLCATPEGENIKWDLKGTVIKLEYDWLFIVHSLSTYHPLTHSRILPPPTVLALTEPAPCHNRRSFSWKVLPY